MLGHVHAVQEVAVRARLASTTVAVFMSSGRSAASMNVRSSSTGSVRHSTPRHGRLCF